MSNAVARQIPHPPAATATALISRRSGCAGPRTRLLLYTVAIESAGWVATEEEQQRLRTSAASGDLAGCSEVMTGFIPGGSLGELVHRFCKATRESTVAVIHSFRKVTA
jgi:hypothetical protein